MGASFSMDPEAQSPMAGCRTVEKERSHSTSSRRQESFERAVLSIYSSGFSEFLQLSM